MSKKHLACKHGRVKRISMGLRTENTAAEVGAGTHRQFSEARVICLTTKSVLLKLLELDDQR